MPAIQVEADTVFSAVEAARRPENGLLRPRRQTRSQSRGASPKVKSDPGSDNTAQMQQQQRSVAVKQEPAGDGHKESIRIKREPEEAHQGRSVRVKVEIDSNEQQEAVVQIKQELKSEDRQQLPLQLPEQSFSGDEFSGGEAGAEEDGPTEGDGSMDEYGDAGEDMAGDDSGDDNAGANQDDDDDDDADGNEQNDDEIGDNNDGGGDDDEAVSDDEAHEINNEPVLALWTWGRHFNTPIVETPGGYIHWLCREPDYFNGSAAKVNLLRQLIEADKVRIVNDEDIHSPHVEVEPIVTNDDYGYWGYCQY